MYTRKDSLKLMGVGWGQVMSGRMIVRFQTKKNSIKRTATFCCGAQCVGVVATGCQIRELCLLMTNRLCISYTCALISIAVRLTICTLFCSLLNQNRSVQSSLDQTTGARKQFIGPDSVLPLLYTIPVYMQILQFCINVVAINVEDWANHQHAIQSRDVYCPLK